LARADAGREDRARIIFECEDRRTARSANRSGNRHRAFRNSPDTASRANMKFRDVIKAAGYRRAESFSASFGDDDAVYRRRAISWNRDAAVSKVA